MKKFEINKIEDFIVETSKRRGIIMFAFIVLHFLILLSFFMFNFSFLPLSIFIALLPSILFFAVIPLVKEEKDKIKFFKLYKVTFVSSSLIIVNGLIKMVMPKTLPVPFGHAKASPIGVICLIVDFLMVILIVFALSQEKDTPFTDNMINTNVWQALKINLFKRKKEVGDVILCKNADNDENVIIPYKDRFLHMLILGPTGSGKTSQTIIPMINQDVQNPNAGVTVIEPKGDLAEKIYAMAQYYGREAIYFNPTMEACPTFNPLYGKEEDVIENITTTFRMLDPDSPQYFKDMNEQLLRNSLKVLKRTKGNQATLIDLSRLVANTNGEGRKIVSQFIKLKAPTEALLNENADIANYFLSDYFAEKSKTYDNTSGIRSQIAKIVSNKFLRKVLNPENGKSDIDFDTHLENGGIICINTAQGKLRDLGKFLGYFIILNFQSSVFKRPGNENTRRAHFLYIDEFQEYSNPGFSQMLTQGRSYRVASHLATQNRALMSMGSGRDGHSFVELVSTNARNIVIYPGGNAADAKFYSDQFGQTKKKETQRSISRQIPHPLFGGKVGNPSESLRYAEEDVARFSVTDIIYREFGEITYAIVQDNTLQVPGIGKISYIPRELNATLDKYIQENNILMTLNYDPNKHRDLKNNGVLNDYIDMEKLEILYKEYELREASYSNDFQPKNESKEPETPKQNTSFSDNTSKAPEKQTTQKNNTKFKPEVPTVDLSSIDEEIFAESSNDTGEEIFIDDDMI